MASPAANRTPYRVPVGARTLRSALCVCTTQLASCRLLVTFCNLHCSSLRPTHCTFLEPASCEPLIAPASCDTHLATYACPLHLHLAADSLSAVRCIMLAALPLSAIPSLIARASCDRSPRQASFDTLCDSVEPRHQHVHPATLHPAFAPSAFGSCPSFPASSSLHLAPRDLNPTSSSLLPSRPVPHHRD